MQVNIEEKKTSSDSLDLPDVLRHTYIALFQRV